jgi:hypothetical protein
MERLSRCTFRLFSRSVLNRAEREIQKRLHRICDSLESTATAKMEKESRRSRANSLRTIARSDIQAAMLDAISDGQYMNTASSIGHPFGSGLLFSRVFMRMPSRA